jgi:hypothetical protein
MLEADLADDFLALPAVNKTLLAEFVLILRRHSRVTAVMRRLTTRYLHRVRILQGMLEVCRFNTVLSVEP